ncbi:hypothetical protein V8E54_002601 [Elaphomyces granulatus]
MTMSVHKKSPKLSPTLLHVTNSCNWSFTWVTIAEYDEGYLDFLQTGNDADSFGDHGGRDVLISFAIPIPQGPQRRFGMDDPAQLYRMRSDSQPFKGITTVVANHEGNGTDQGTWADTEHSGQLDFTPKLSSMIKLARMLVAQHVWEQCQKSTIRKAGDVIFDLKVGFGLVPSLNMMLEALGLFGGFVSDYAAVYGYKKPDPDEVDV